MYSQQSCKHFCWFIFWQVQIWLEDRRSQKNLENLAGKYFFIAKKWTSWSRQKSFKIRWWNSGKDFSGFPLMARQTFLDEIFSVFSLNSNWIFFGFLTLAHTFCTFNISLGMGWSSSEIQLNFKVFFWATNFKLFVINFSKCWLAK